VWEICTNGIVQHIAAKVGLRVVGGSGAQRRCFAAEIGGRGDGGALHMLHLPGSLAGRFSLAGSSCDRRGSFGNCGYSLLGPRCGRRPRPILHGYDRMEDGFVETILAIPSPPLTLTSQS
jgi:hypothetical protein